MQDLGWLCHAGACRGGTAWVGGSPSPGRGLVPSCRTALNSPAVGGCMGRRSAAWMLLARAQPEGCRASAPWPAARVQLGRELGARACTARKEGKGLRCVPWPQHPSQSVPSRATHLPCPPCAVPGSRAASGGAVPHGYCERAGAGEGGVVCAAASAFLCRQPWHGHCGAPQQRQQ